MSYFLIKFDHAWKLECMQIELIAPEEVASQCPLKSFKFYKTKEVPTGFYDIKTGHLNTRTPWWYIRKNYYYFFFV